MRKSFLLTLFSCLCLALPAQDFGLWTGLSVEKDFGKKFSLEAGADYRAEHNATSAARWDVGFGGSYKPLKWLKVGAGYVFITDKYFRTFDPHYKESIDAEGNTIYRQNGYNSDHPFWRNKHRIYLDVQGKHTFGRFSLTLRERYQMTRFVADSTLSDKYRGIAPDGYENQYGGYAYDRTDWDYKKAKTRHYLRSRLQLEYNIRHCPVTPYASYEMSNNLTDAFAVEKHRIAVGADWKVSKQHRIGLAYIYQTGTDDDPEDKIHAIEVSYKFKF